MVYCPNSVCGKERKIRRDLTFELYLKQAYEGRIYHPS